MFGVLGYKNTKNDSSSCSYQIPISLIRSGCMKKMTEMRSIVWVTNAFGCSFA